jgi:hypothetical protein
VSEIEIIETQNTIIKLQSDVINELFSVLSQHLQAEELDSLPVVEKINAAARLRQSYE